MRETFLSFLKLNRRGAFRSVALVLLLFCASCDRKKEFSDGVRLMWSGEYLEPSTTLELRFNENMSKPDEAGLPAQVPPLRILPPLNGSFVWLSRQSGVFVPSEPYKLNTTYKVSLAEGLLREDGQPSRARLLRQLKTPSLECKLFGYNYFDPSNAVARPRLDIFFNAPIETNGASANVFFADASGRRIKGKLDFSETDSSEFGFVDDVVANNSALTWQQRFYVARPKYGSRITTIQKTGHNTGKAVNRLTLEPVAPLPEGKGWKLVIAKGFASTEPGLSLTDAAEFKIGDVNPFLVASAESDNGVGVGKAIHLSMNKPLSPVLTVSNLSEWIQVTPAPSNLELRPSWQGIDLSGDFKLNECYRVRLKNGLPSGEEDFVLAKPFTQDFVFKAIPPRLYFPAFSADQLASGGRTVELMSVNVRDIRMRAKILDASTAIHGLRGYRSYLTRPERNRDLVDFSGVPGRTLLETNLHIDAKIDETSRSVISWDDILKDRRHGIVFFEAECVNATNRPAVQSILQLTDLGLLWKNTKDHVWVYAFSYKTSLPLPSMPIQLMGDENETLAEAVTDGSGIAVFDRKPEGIWLLARNGSDMHAVNIGSWEGQLSPFGFGVPVRWNDDEPEGKIMILSDRPVYRSSDVLYCKLIARDWQDSGFAIPANRHVAVKCYDARDRLFCETNMLLSAMGSADFSTVLPDASLGHYRIQAAITNTAEAVHFFQVRDYKPNAFEILAQAKPAYAAGEAIEIPVDAQYFFGQHLTKAKLHWSLTAHDTGFIPTGYEGYSFSTEANLAGMPQADASFFAQGNVIIEKGKICSLTPEIPVNQNTPQPRSVNLLLECTDLNQQTVSHQISFLRQSSDFYLGLKPNKSMPSVGKSVRVEIIAVAADGTSRASKTRITCRKVEWVANRSLGASGSLVYRNEIQFKDVAKTEMALQAHKRPEAKKSKIADALASEVEHGDAFEFTPGEGGVYLVEAETEDEQNRKVKSAVAIYVYGADEVAWNYRSEKRMELIADRDLYAPGETAKILVKTPIAGAALVSIERDAVIRTFTTNLTGNAPVIEIPLFESDAPNVFVSIFLARGSDASTKAYKTPEYRLGYCQIAVHSPAKKLEIGVQTDAKNYLPGQSVHAEVTAKDHLGAPLPGAEVTLFAVDEGVLSLVEDKQIDPVAFFQEIRPLAVHSGCSISRLIPEDPEQLRFQNKGTVIGDGGVAAMSLRKNFQACAFWTASLESDPQGMVRADFKAPDNLTRFRIVAVAHTEKSQFGKGQAAIEINKPIQVEPVLPRFACVDDRIEAKALVQNNMDQALDVVVEVELDGKATLAGPGATGKEMLHVNPHSAASTPFTFMMKGAGKAVWKWRVSCADATANIPGDWVQSTLPIQDPAPVLKEVHIGRSLAASTNLLAPVNPLMLEGHGTVSVRLSSSMLAEIGEAVSDLFHYPYGCMEQTCSSLLPWLVLKDQDMIRSSISKPPQDIPAVVRTGIQGIFSMQTDSGGLAYWPGNRDPMYWCSAYGAMTLALAKRSEYPVASADFDKLLAWLGRVTLEKASDLDESSGDPCLALYALALAGKPEPALNEILFRKRAKLSAESQALLALAILESHGPAEMISSLLEKGGNSSDDPWFGSPSRALSIQLLAWLNHRSQDNRVDVLLEEIIRTRENGHWLTTQGNAWAVMALAEYVRRVENSTLNIQGSLKRGDQTIPFTLEPNKKQCQTIFDLATGTTLLPIMLENPAKSALFAQIAVESITAHISVVSQSKGFAIRRRYSIVDDNGEIHDWAKPGIGARVLVDLFVESSQPAHFVVVEDRLPCILEPLQPEFASQQTQTGLNNPTRWMGDHQEFRDGRALFFCDHLPQGLYSIRYLARVQASGTVTAPPAKVEEMYHPERFGMTATETLTSLPQN